MNDPKQTVDESGRNEADPVPPVSSPEPQQIGRYRIERLLGQGSFGLVYLAHDDQLARPVAIKVPHPYLVAEVNEAVAYLAEARMVAKLDHSNIVPVYDVGSNEDYPCFVVAKFIEGSTLAERIKQNRPSVAEATELVAAVAETLHYAHRKGLVHRDIKPGNILLDTTGKPFVADFGLALSEEQNGHGSRYAGTPSYMSPEQACGEGRQVDGRADIFSLGVVYYELLTRRLPFRGETKAELLEQIARLETRPPRQIDDTIPEELERICLKALSKRPSDRYTTAKDMADDLRGVLARLKGVREPSVRGSRSGSGLGMSPPALGRWHADEFQRIRVRRVVWIAATVSLLGMLALLCLLGVWLSLKMGGSESPLANPRQGKASPPINNKMLRIVKGAKVEIKPLPIWRFTLINRSGSSQVLHRLDCNVYEFIPPPGPPPTRVLHSIAMWDIELSGKRPCSFSPQAPILLAADDAVTIDVRFHEKTFDGDWRQPEGAYKVQVRFVTDQGLVAESESFSLYGGHDWTEAQR